MAVFVLGWASDARFVEHIRPQGYDILAVYDFRTIETVRLPEYREKYLFAWSFGVWAAEHIFAGESFDKAVALCGSPFPSDDRYGLGRRRIKLTIKGLPAGMDAFYRASLSEYYERFADTLPVRTAETNREELEALAKMSAEPYIPAIEWDAAVIGERDLIFPPANLKKFWGERASVRNLPHYPFEDDIIEWIKR